MKKGFKRTKYQLLDRLHFSTIQAEEPLEIEEEILTYASIQSEIDIKYFELYVIA